MNVKKPYRIVEFDGGCMIPLSHIPNQDGYFRIYMPNYHTRLPMMYRIIWELHNGPIPEGYEIDHVCKCRACVNPCHLRAIEGRKHAIESNSERYREIREKGIEMWKQGYSSQEIAETLSRKLATVKKWIREEKRNGKSISNK